MTFVSFFLVDTLLHSRNLKRSPGKQYEAPRGYFQSCILVQPYPCPLGGVKRGQSFPSQVIEYDSQWHKRGHWSLGSSPTLFAGVFTHSHQPNFLGQGLWPGPIVQENWHLGNQPSLCQRKTSHILSTCAQRCPLHSA